MAPYKNRKGGVSQNVLAVCSFGLQFTYVLPGWEGSAHDARVLNDAIQAKGFTIPQGKYYLADAGYANRDWLITPYRGVKYHLKETIGAGLRYVKSLLNTVTNDVFRPHNKEELFNLRHSSLRNAIERIFGILKRRFKILRSPPEYAFQHQVLLVLALCGLHNFIRNHAVEGEEELGLDDASVLNEGVNRDNESLLKGFTGNAIDKKRDEMAQKMWDDYRIYTSRLH